MENEVAKDIQSNFTCSACGSNNILIQVVNESKLVKKYHSLIWWLLIGWWFVPFMWFVFFIPKLFIKLFGIGHKRQKIVNKSVKKGLCQQCGNMFNV